MIRIYGPAIFIVAADISAVRCPLSPVVVAFLANGHQVLRVEEESHVPFVVPPMVDDWAVWCRRFAYEEPAAAGPLTYPVVPVEDPVP
jgi:hypothetical protein